MMTGVVLVTWFGRLCGIFVRISTHLACLIHRELDDES